MKSSSLSLILSCEHGGNRVPKEYRSLFAGRRRLLASHRGWDPGARDVAKRLAARLGAPLIASDVTRLLVDLNRVLDSPTLLSKWTCGFDAPARARLIDRYYTPYRKAVRSLVERELATGARVLHVSIHSFAAVLRGQVRDLDVGLLFDPSYVAERRVCALLGARIRRIDSGLRVRSNRPYRGTDDGMTTALRAELDRRRYVGIEIEMNQRIVRRPPGVERLARVLGTALEGVVQASR